VQEAEGNASRFKQILVEYNKAPAITRERLYLDMMQSVLGSTSKVLIDQKGGNSLLYLPLDQLLRQSQTSTAPSGAGAEGARATPPPDAGVTLEPSRQPREMPRGRERGGDAR
jgi:modulator of FtsH protease HflK